MKRIAIIYDLTDSGGVQTCVLSLVRELNSKGITPTLFWDSPPNSKLLADFNVRLQFVKVNFTMSSRFIKRLPNILRYFFWPFNSIYLSQFSGKFDFVYSFSPYIIIDTNLPHLIYSSGPPLIPQLESSSFRFKLVKLIFHLIFSTKYPVYKTQKLANYVVNSNFIAKLFTEAHKRSVEVIYPSNQFASKADQYGGKKFYTTFFSRIVEYKRPEYLIELASRFPQQQFIIMGGLTRNNYSYHSKLKAAVRAKNIQNIEIYSNPELGFVQDVLSKTSVYIFPAEMEHFGITTVEAIEYGAIPLVHDSGGQREIVLDSNLRFQRFDDLLKKYTKLLSLDESELQNIRINLLKSVERFSEAEYRKRIIEPIEIP